MSNKYIKFSNRADNVNRLALEKLGFSTKRNDPNTIGQFGSGIKFAPISAVRQGLQWHFVGKDDNGSYHLQYVVMKENDIECIFYDYGDVLKSSSFTIDAGSLSWDSAFQIYREAFANAIDSAETSDDWSVSIVDEEDVMYEDGWFSCFISASPEMMEVHNNFDLYFSVNRECLFTWVREWDKREYKVLKKKTSSGAYVYSFGVRIFHTDEVNTVFDYDIKNIPLNEERTVKSLWELETEVARVVSRISDPDLQAQYLNHCINGSADNYFEFARVGSITWQAMVYDPSWKSTFANKFGENAVIYDQIAAAKGIREYIKLRGMVPVYVSSDQAFNFLKCAGVTPYTNITDESVMYETEFDLCCAPKLREAIDIASFFQPEIADLAVAGKIGLYNGDNYAIGLTINMNKDQNERIILVDKTHAKDSSIESIVATLIHEFDHLSTGYADGNAEGRAFRDLADERIGKLMVKFYQQSLASVQNGVVYFDMNKMTSSDGFSATFSIEPIATLGKNLLKIGKMFFTINQDCLFDGLEIIEPVYGLLSVADSGVDFTVYGLTNIKELENL